MKTRYSVILTLILSLMGFTAIADETEQTSDISAESKNRDDLRLKRVPESFHDRCQCERR